MISSTRPRCDYPLDFIETLRNWANSSRAEKDLETVFGQALHWPAAYRHLDAFRRGDFSLLPRIEVLEDAAMPGLWGGYSRELRLVFLSADCPEELIVPVLLEEIGHFFDQDFCQEETPGDEGARFAAAVMDSALPPEVDDEPAARVCFRGMHLPVEAAPKTRGNATPKTRVAPATVVPDTTISQDGTVVYANKDSVRIVQTKANQRLVGSKGNDTFVVNNATARIEDPNGGTDTVESTVSFSLLNLGSIENLTLAGTANLNATGNILSNFIRGNAGNNLIDAQSGKDTVSAGGGHDTILGGVGDDSLLGEDGNDSLDGSIGNDTLLGGVGNDVLNGGSGINSLIGGAGNDTYFVESPADKIFELAGVAGGIDTIVTSNRNITLLTYANIEKIVYIGTPGGGGGSGGGSLISTLGSANDDSLFGNDSANTLLGLAGNDTLDAKGENDYLDGGTGIDSMIGGTGNDIYIVDSALDAVVETDASTLGGTDLVISSVSYTLGNNVENLTLNASLAVADANINGSGNALSNIITGNSGNNQLDGGGGADTLRGGAGNDILNGGTGDGVGDLLEGGEGNDRYLVGSTLDVIRDSGGTDTVETTVSFDIGDTLRVEGIEHLIYKGSNVAATLTGNTGDNSLISEGTGADTLIAGAGNDTLNGGTGANSLIGGAGDDYYIVNSASDKIFEDSLTGSGLDTVLTKVATFSLGANSNVEILTYDPLGTAKTNLSGSDSDNTITGGNFGNSLSGFGGNDYLLGGVQADTLVGGDDNDTLDGKAGVNSLVGGAGDDYYITDSQSVNILEDTLSSGGNDTVRSSVAFNLSYSNKLGGIEGLYLTGSASLAGTGNSLDNTITGNDGNNVLSGKLGNDNILGGLGADYIKGDEGDDSLVGGGDIQGDVPADASTPIQLASGQTYTGQINSRNETDWIKVELLAGVIYTISLDNSLLVGASVIKDRSDVAFGAQGSDQYWPTWQDGIFGYQPPLVGDKDGQTSGAPWVGNLTDHDELVLNSNGSVAYGYIDPASIAKSTKYSNNIIGFQFTPFESGTFYIPVSGAGPALGSYRVTLTAPDNLSSVTPALADNASNTLIGGLGADTLVAGNGRDAQGNAIGDILLGGTNGLVGSVDTDTLGDNLIGGDGNDSLDGGNGANSLIGGKGNDYYYIRSSLDQIVEKTDGGDADAMIVNFSATLGGEWDIVLDPDHTPIGPAFQFVNIENVTLTGSANTSVLGSPNSDKIVGNFGNNKIDGQGGDDTLLGMGGNDTLIGGEGADSLDGGSGTSTMVGGFGSDTYVVNDRSDRIINEEEGLDGGEDLVRTYYNFDPIQGLDENGGNTFAPDLADFSPSITKSPSFASRDLESFYNLEHFELLGAAVYGVGNALNNSITAGPSSALLLGNGGVDTLIGAVGDDSLFGDTPDFYATPDLYASAAKDTISKDFLLKTIGKDADNNYEYVVTYASDYLEGGTGNNYLDGGRSFDTMIGGAGNDTFVQDNTEDYIVAGGGVNELISSVNINQAPDGISKLMLVVATQAADSGQAEVASFGSFLGTQGGNNRSESIKTGNKTLSITNANTLELMYAPRAGQVFGFMDGDTPPDAAELIVGASQADPNNAGKVQYELTWNAGVNAATDVVGYTVRYKIQGDSNDIWHTYVNGKSQDFQGTWDEPILVVNNLDAGGYDFEVTAIERTIPALQDGSAAQHVTLQGGSGNDAVLGLRLNRQLPGGLLRDIFTDPLVENNPNSPLFLPGSIFNPAPYDPVEGMPARFATYLDGGFGNDLLIGDFVNDRSGEDYDFQDVTFKGLNTLIGGQGTDTFVVVNGGNTLGDEFDWVVKYGNETPIVTEAGNIGSSLNGGQHNLVVSVVPYLKLSDELVYQGKFIDQLLLAGTPDPENPEEYTTEQVGMGNRLDNYISGAGTLVGDKGRDSISGAGLLIGGTAYGFFAVNLDDGEIIMNPDDDIIADPDFQIIYDGGDNVGKAVRDFADITDGGNGLTNSIYRDTDPIPVSPNGPGVADPSQFWFVPGYYGGVFDPNRNQDTLIADLPSTLDGGAGRDSMMGSETPDQTGLGGGDMFIVSQGEGGPGSQSIGSQDAVFGNGGNDTVTFTDSDYLWWSGHIDGDILDNNSYSIERGPADGVSDISNLILQAGAPSARNAIGNDDSKGNFGQGSNYIVGNEFDNILDGGGVGGLLGLGTGVDILIGGSGKDNFVVEGYTNSTSNQWKPEIIDYTEGPDAGFSLWLPQRDKSIYTDADYVVIMGFEAGDNLQLLGEVSGYWIGAAPSGDGIPDFTKESSLNNIPLLSYLDKPKYDEKNNITQFGIYRAGTPNLVAIVNFVGELSWDTLELPDNYNPAPSDKVATDGPFRAHLGWGTFWKLQGSSFADYVIFDPDDYTPEDGIASLPVLVHSGDETFQGDVGADTFNGYGGNDSIIGDDGNDTFLGGSGQDTLLGEAGNDSLLGEDGADYLNGGSGIDDLIGGLMNDTYVVDDLGDDVIEVENEGTDLVLASVSGYILKDHVENLTLTDNAIDGTGNALDNRLTGNAENNTLTGLDGDDTLEGGAGVDTLQGGDDDDFYLVDDAGDTIEDSGGTDTVLTSGSFDLSDSKVADTDSNNIGDGIEHLIFIGTTLGVELTGNATNNSIIGGAGSDTLDGKAGNDTLIGGAGDDYYVYTATAGNDRIVDFDGTDTILTDTSFDLAATTLNTSVVGLANIENIQLTSTTGASLFGNSLNNSIIGNSGNDTLNGRASSGTLSGDTLNGGDGNDYYIVDSTIDEIIEAAAGGDDTIETSDNFDLSNTLIGGLKNIENIVGVNGGITLTGNINANSLIGGAGSQYMVGGIGNDTYIVGSGDVASESEDQGMDLVVASSSYTLGVHIENLVLDGSANIHGTGNSLANIITGNSGNNSLNGAVGADTLIGSDGNDTFFVDNVSDSLVGGADTDYVISSITYTLGSDFEHLLLAGSDSIGGTGNSLDNTITGNASANTLNGGEGKDTLVGLGGDDSYVINSLDDDVVEAAGEGTGTDMVTANVTGYTLDDNVENLTLGTGIADGTGNSLDNTIIGNASSNMLVGGTGADTLVGLGGDDSYEIDSLEDFVVEASGAGTDLVTAKVTGYTLAANVENLTLGTGIAVGTGNSLDNTITGNASTNTLNGGDGKDTLVGLGGNDIYVINSLDDDVVENVGDGTDMVTANVTGYTLDDNVENLTLGTEIAVGTGNSLNNTITGNASANTLNGGDGKDTLVGLGGDDSYVINSLDDLVVEASGDGTGTDLVTANVTGYTLADNVENLTLGTGIAVGTGNSLDNMIAGNVLSNNINGGDGNDTLIGSTNRGIGESDTLTGGSGIDLFVLGDKSNPYYATVASAGDYALITDFAVDDGDQLQLKDLSTGAHVNTIKGYLIGSQIYGAIDSSNSYLYRDTNNTGLVDPGDNLIAAMNATGGTGVGGILQTSDLNTIGVFVS